MEIATLKQVSDAVIAIRQSKLPNPKELGNSVNIESLVAGQPIDVMVLGDSVERGLLILSLKRANQIKSLNALNSNFASGQVMTVRPTEANKG